MLVEHNPFATLKNIDELSEKQSAIGQAIAESQSQWRGIGFSMGQCKYVAPLDEVYELLNLPRYTRIPGTKGWIKGVANLRGKLLSITDLEAFFDDSRSSLSGQRPQILVINTGDILTGLVIHKALGMKRFPIDSKALVNDDAHMDLAMTPYITGQFEHNGENWYIFSPQKLLESVSFSHVVQ